ncbi:MAG: hypothetical protein EZS28_016852 [Streblomastix strix]|uniref:Uncharacterized protein n=1 Tax=Streblomastix strix TaxID=222440 RepID=A0A5J4VYZ0_9EUKA|nr:MAG: hypothetical protein EZS28_016852 [Streblomastix strix]
MFANKSNRKLKRLISLTQDSWAVTQDCMSILLTRELPSFHPPIPLIQASPNNVMKGNIQAVIVVLYWPSQSWKPRLMGLTLSYINLCEIFAIRLKVTEARNSSGADIDKGQESLKNSGQNPGKCVKIELQFETQKL